MRLRRLLQAHQQLLRYALVGLISNLLGYVLYLLVTYLGVGPKIAMSLLYFVGASIGFFGNKTLTFKHEGHYLSSSLRYALAHFAGYLLNLSILVVFVDQFGYPHQWVQAVAIFVVAVFLFLLFKFFVFPEKKGLSTP